MPWFLGSEDEASNNPPIRVKIDTRQQHVHAVDGWTTSIRRVGLRDFEDHQIIS